jgi:hypothetical protein
MYERRQFLLRLTALMLAGPLVARAADAGPLVQVYKSPTCGCCGKWVDHLRAAGFTVQATNVADVNQYKLEYGVPVQLASCHTAIVEGYIVEGHVPADDVIKMLREKPAIKGIAVPGMPLGSPGMESLTPERYETIAFDADGNTTVFAIHEP